MRIGSWVLLVAVVSAIASACGTSGEEAPAQPAGDGGTTDGPAFVNNENKACVPKTCAELGYDCGQNSDGCGNLIDCGSCKSPAFCGAAGFSKCGGNLEAVDGGGSLCHPKTCADQGFECGMNSDGCGNLLDCGTCASPGFCGAAGFSKCGGNAIAADAGGNLCVPKTCADLGYNCGDAGDGCGHTLHCGSCQSPAYCGGAGFSTCGGNLNALDGGSICVPRNCTQMGYSCGPAGDGCGNVIANCGTCAAPQWCGGGGFAKCGGNTNYLDGGNACVKKTCGQLGYNCGPANDGCGGLLNCGTCTNPGEICGANAPGVCGGLPCTNLCPYQNNNCGGAGKLTTLTGRVVGGTQGVYGLPDPVPNVVVYIPNSNPLAFSQGVSCSQCGAEVTGDPLVQTTTDYLGNFTLANVPTPPNGQLPVVIQLGRWRRKVTINFTPCVSTNVGDIHMPRNKGEGDIPLTAISTGSWDAMECVLLKMGVDQAEFTVPWGSGRIHMYQGNGVDMVAGAEPETTLTDQPSFFGNTLEDYDQVLLPCWGADARAGSRDYSGGVNVKSSLAKSNLKKYLDKGGRAFATHFSYAWLFDNSPLSSTATWVTDLEPKTATANIQTTPTKVNTFYQWMNALMTAGSVNGTFGLNDPRYNISAVDTTKGDLWVNATNPQPPYEYVGSPTAPATFPVLYTFETPLGASAQCGRGVFSAFHVTVVTSASGNTSGQTFPNECVAAPMNAQEKALEYQIWNLASCVPGPPVPKCTPRGCNDQGVHCGPAGDGCGAQIDCGPCPAGQTCGGGGVFATCGSVDGGTCVPRSCQAQGIECGPAGDGCGNPLQCGPCTPPETCGGANVPGKCGFIDGGSCIPSTCQAQGIACGPAADGCGGVLQCGVCVAPLVCGGAGVNGQCGFIDGGSCQPFTCNDLGLHCGPAGNGCGGLLDCGTCVPPETCGGGGIPGECGFVDGGSCKPLTCKDQKIECGPAGDGCGHLMQCGDCTPPSTCGGGGKPGVCEDITK